MKNQIFNENNLITMSKMTDKSIDGIITSPPYGLRMYTKRKDCYYNNGYADIDNLSEEDYIDTRIKEFKEFSRVLKDKGVILYNMSYNNANAILPILLMSEIHQQTDLTVIDIISWIKSQNIPFQTSPRLLSRKSEQVYVIVKKSHLHDFTANKKISKINSKTGQKFYKNYINIIEARNNDNILCKLKSAFSEDFVTKIADIYFPEESIIYDPFMGIGTTARACKKTNRYFIGSELDKELYDISIKLLV